MSTAAATDTQAVVTALNAGWYNAVSDAMGLQNDPSFLLAQGTLGLQTTDSSGLFRMSDAVPPSAAVAYFDAGGTDLRSSAYPQLLGALLPETGTGLAAVLGDQYVNWITYRNAYVWPTPPAAQPTQEQVFEAWANQRLDPGLASQAITTYKQAANSQLNAALNAYHATNAQQQFVNSSGNTFSLYTYSATVDAAKAAIATGASTSINFNSATMNTTLSHTTAQGSASGFYDIFSGGAGASFDQLNTTAASSGWSISGNIGSYATLATQPGSWYTSGEVSRAYNSKNDNTIWDPMGNSGTWDSFFAQPNGSLARHISQLILVSDYKITVTSQASYSSEDLTKIQTQASFGIWPFFSAEASTSQTTDVTLNSNSNLVVTHTLNKGLIQIWGVTTLNAPQ
jgi:hypothetical protein